MLNVLFVGDIVGMPGRNALGKTLSGLVEEHSTQVCIGNAENAAGGFGSTPQVADDLFSLGFHALISGDHIFYKREIINHLANEPHILRPAISC